MFEKNQNTFDLKKFISNTKCIFNNFKLFDILKLSIYIKRQVFSEKIEIFLKVILQNF